MKDGENSYSLSLLPTPFFSLNTTSQPHSGLSWSSKRTDLHKPVFMDSGTSWVNQPGPAGPIPGIELEQ